MARAHNFCASAAIRIASLVLDYAENVRRKLQAGNLRSTTQLEGPHNTTEVLSAKTVYHAHGRITNLLFCVPCLVVYNSARSGVWPLRAVWLSGIFSASGLLGTDMSSEIRVALAFVLHLHLVDGFADERPCRCERPCTFRTSPALEILAFDPQQLATHCRHSTPQGFSPSCIFEKRPSTGRQRHCDKNRSFLPLP